MEKKDVGEPTPTGDKPAVINFEKIGTIGTLANLMVYLSTVFNMKNITAAMVINIFNGTSNIAPLLGAFLSDSHFGRYKILAFASISSLLVWAFFYYFSSLE